MMKSWPLLALAVLGGVAAVFCLAAFEWTAWACRLPAGEDGKVLTPGFGGCVEFWFNRYQTTVGAAAALVAGYAAWRGAMNQVLRADNQIELLNKQLAIDRIDYVNKRLMPIDGVVDGITQVQDICNSAINTIKDAKRIAEEICYAIVVNNDQRVTYLEGEYKKNKNVYKDQMTSIRNNIRSIAETASDHTLSRDLRGSIPGLCDKVEGFYAKLEDFERIMLDYQIIEFSPRPVGKVKEVFERISSEISDLPSTFSLYQEAAFARFMQEREKLLENRRRAEVVAES